MSIETDDLAVLRETTSKTLLAVLWLHVPIAIAIGLARGEGWITPAMKTPAPAITAAKNRMLRITPLARIEGPPISPRHQPNRD